MASGALHPGSNPGEESVKIGSRRFKSCAGKDEIVSGFCVTYASRYVAKAQLKLISDFRVKTRLLLASVLRTLLGT